MIREGSERPQVKVCGLTRAGEAEGCAALGADAVGLVFHEKSPRFVSDGTAGEIARALPGEVRTVGVFVDEDYAGVMDRVERVGLSGVQLHGAESPELVRRLRRQGLIVIKSLFAGREPRLEEAFRYDASGYLAEGGRARRPGGNASDSRGRSSLDGGARSHLGYRLGGHPHSPSHTPG